MQKVQATGNAGSSPPPTFSFTKLHGNVHPDNNPVFNSYIIPPMMAIGGTQQGGLHPQSQTMHQSATRQPSPGPQQQV